MQLVRSVGMRIARRTIYCFVTYQPLMTVRVWTFSWFVTFSYHAIVVRRLQSRIGRVDAWGNKCWVLKMLQKRAKNQAQRWAQIFSSGHFYLVIVISCLLLGHHLSRRVSLHDSFRTLWRLPNHRSCNALNFMSCVSLWFRYPWIPCRVLRHLIVQSMVTAEPQIIQYLELHVMCHSMVPKHTDTLQSFVSFVIASLWSKSAIDH